MGIVIGIWVFIICFTAMAAILSGGWWENVKWLGTQMWYACAIFCALYVYMGIAFWETYLLTKTCNGQVVSIMGDRQCVPSPVAHEG